MGMAIPAAAMVVGTAISAKSSYDAASSIEDASEFNGEVKEGQALYIEQKAGADVASHRRNFDRFRGALVSDIAAYGGSASSGTGLLMAQEAARQAKLDELNIIVDGKNQANSVRAGAAIDKYEAASTAHQRRLGGLGTAISGFGQAAYSYA